jgi:hypothetical protein
MAFLDEADATGAVTTSAEITIEVHPTLDSSVLHAIRRALPGLVKGDGIPELLPLDLADASVMMRRFGIPWDGGPVHSAVTFRDGGTITVRLTESQFPVLFAALQDPVPAITGAVRTQAAEHGVEVPLLGSFFDAAGSEVGAARVGDSCVIENRSIGTVKVEAAELVSRGSGAVIDLALKLPCELAAGEQIGAGPLPAGLDLDDYYLDARAAICEIPVLSDPSFLHSLMLTVGYLSTGHDVAFTLRDPGALARIPASATSGPVTAVRVEVAAEATGALRPDPIVVLDVANPSRTARVRSDVVDGLLPQHQATADRFFHRVVNVHGTADGAASEWRESTGDRVDVEPIG